VSAESVLHRLIDSVFGGSGNAHLALELHQEVDEKDEAPPANPPVPPTTEGE
jgi:hypothetical protein